MRVVSWVSIMLSLPIVTQLETSLETSLSARLAGSNSGSISSSRATGRAAGVNDELGTYIGGLVGINVGTVRDSYATGKVTGNNYVGGLAGRNESTITNSYASGQTTGTGSQVGEFIGSQEGKLVGNSGARTLTQLQCPTAPPVNNETCSGATIYSGWSTGLWYFGSARTLPLLRTQVDIPATPTALAASWQSANTLQLSWQHTGAIAYELEIEGTLQESASTSFHVSDTLLVTLRENAAGGEVVSYSVRASETSIAGYPETGAFSLLDSPGVARVSQVTTRASSLIAFLEAPENDGYGRAPDNPDYGGQVDNIALNLRYSVQIFRNQNEVPIQEKEVVLEFSNFPARVNFLRLGYPSTYQLVAVAKNVVGAGEMAATTFRTASHPSAPPVISAPLESTFRVIYGTTSKKMTISASAPVGQTLNWTLPGNPQYGRVYFLTDTNAQEQQTTGRQVTVVYESNTANGITEAGRLQVRAMNENGTDTITINVVPDMSPAITGDRNRTIDIYTRGTHSVQLVLTAQDFDGPAENLQWTWSSIDLPANTNTSVRLTTRAVSEESITTVTFSHLPGSLSTGTFVVKVADETGGSDMIRVSVRTIPNRSPLIAGSKPQMLEIIEGRTTVSLVLGTSDPEPGNVRELQWSVATLPNALYGSSLDFIVDGSTATTTTGPAVRLLFARPDGSALTGEFEITVTDPLLAFDNVQIIVHETPNSSPIITEFAGREVSNTNTLTFFINPEIREVTMRAIAQDEFLDELEWAITPNRTNLATVRFVVNGNEYSTVTSGTSEVQVNILRAPDLGGTADDSFGLEVFDHIDNSDLLRVNVVSPNLPMVTIAQGATLTQRILFEEREIVVELNTINLWAGLIWSIEDLTLGSEATFTGSNRESRVRLRLTLGELEEASFTIKVATGNNNASPSDEIKVTILRRDPIDLYDTDCIGQNGFAGSQGTSSSPYRIATLSQLQRISSASTRHYQLVDDIDIDASPTRNWNWDRAENAFRGFSPSAISLVLLTAMTEQLTICLSTFLVETTSACFQFLAGTAH